ncbi:MAG: PilZ domain-containing protein [Vicinamibacterales bacterium]
MSTGHRDSERIPVLGALQGEVKVYHPMTVHQVSLGGMQVETSFPLHLDSLHDFRLTLRDRSIVIKGRVAHSRIIDVDQDIVMYRSGIEFIEPSGPVLAAIAELIEELKLHKG